MWVGLIFKLPALWVCGHLVGISWKQDTQLTEFFPQLFSVSGPLRTKVNSKVYPKNATKYKSWIFMFSILMLQTENNFIMRNLSNFPKINNCMLFSWSVNALMISRHIINQYNLIWHVLEEIWQLSVVFEWTGTGRITFCTDGGCTTLFIYLISHTHTLTRKKKSFCCSFFFLFNKRHV